MRPMTIVVVREEPAGGSVAGVSVFAGAADADVAAGAADAAVAGAGAAVSGAEAVVAAVEAGAAGLAVVWENPADAARRSTARTAESAGRRFMAGETIGRGRGRQAAGRAA